MNAAKKLFIISGVIISLFIAGLLLPETNLIFGILLLPTIWMIHYRNIRKGWFWILFFITGILLSLKIENSFISVFVSSINFPSLIFAIRRTFFVRGKITNTKEQKSGNFNNEILTHEEKLISGGRLAKPGMKLILAVAGILFVFLAFYWFQLRPNDIRKACAEEALAKQGGKRGKVTSLFGKDTNYDEMINNDYRLCLNGKGLKPESLFVK